MVVLIKKIVKKIFGVKIIHKIEEHVYASNLDKLAQIYNTDKFGRHSYTSVYSSYFKTIRKKRLSILEIGVGGYDNPNRGGASLKMWKRYFPNSKITAIDIHDKSQIQEKRITIFKGSQDDEIFLNEVVNKTGNYDIIIDDGSHINKHVVFSFKHLFSKLNEKGIYVVEDTQTSYWDDMGGDSHDLNAANTSMNFFKKLVDSVNQEEFDSSLVDSIYVDQIEAIHFFHNLIFIFKK